MKIPNLPVASRSETGSRACRTIRGEGRIPTVLYGRNFENKFFSVDRRTFSDTLKTGARVVDLSWESETQRAFLKSVQYDYLGDAILHADFQTVSMDEKIHFKVALVFQGEPKGLKDGGILEQLITDVEVECLPGDIPENLPVKIDGLGIGDALHLSELPLPPGVTLGPGIGDVSQVVVHLVMPKGEDETLGEAEAGEEAVAGPEIIREKERAEKEKGEDE